MSSLLDDNNSFNNNLLYKIICRMVQRTKTSELFNFYWQHTFHNIGL